MSKQSKNGFFTDDRREYLAKQLGECKRYIRGRWDDEDLFQEVCVRCVQATHNINSGIHKADSPEALHAFIYKVARGKRIDIYRKETVRKATSHEPDPAPISRELGPVDAAVEKERYATVHERIERLPDKYREVIVEQYFLERTPSVIAKKLDIPLETVKTRLRRAREILASDRILRECYLN